MSDSLSAAAAEEAIEASDEPVERSEALWAAVVSLSLGVFGLVTAEFLPASLLTPIAADLGISNGAAGQAVTATAVVGAIAAPTTAILTKGIDRRLVMWTFTLLLIVSSILAATASGLVTLLVARVVLGVALGGFWSMAGAMAMRLVPSHLMPRALSIVFTGVSVATVCAAPVGAYIGDLWGWRTAFALAAGIGVVTLVVQMLSIPRLPPVGAPGLASLAKMLRRPSVSMALLATLLIASGHFAGFTYVRPFLEEVPALDIETISFVLLAFGIGGFFGNLFGGFLIERSLKADIGTGALAIAAAALVLVLLGSSEWLSAGAVTLWGFAFGMLPVGLQTWIVRAAPDQAESAGGLLVTAFQVAIAGGAIFGGLLVDGFGPLGAFIYAGTAMLAGALLVFSLGARSLPRAG
ncbi:MFS transporter [Kumtagia ephedrae]|uniref:MFS transporter n=1 Tax=Kumtagia ephedrae TaxID=2116701 RepID=A0A2P7SSZ1_9HYPH|nr:MFS transporter [Mesorhizobium ephedrae]PSJ65609.1 MFS transporter [Mesorhizobium ephedrae]